MNILTKALIFLSLLAFLTGCGQALKEPPLITARVKEAVWVDLSKRDKLEAITDQPWHEVAINVSDFDDIAPLFTQIGQYETIDQGYLFRLLRAPGTDGGYIRLQKISSAAKPARPASSLAWDKGCYFSLMMRAKNLESIIQDAASLGWVPLTEMAYLEFGPSKLHIVVLTHTSGLRVQLYERLTTPLPVGFPEFKRISRPFNIMQMVEDRDAGYEFFQQKLGFDTFFYGPPYVSETAEVMPLGLPRELTTTIPYKTAIMTPKAGLEWGRMEMIDIENMPGGINYSGRCNMEHTGIISVKFLVDDISAISQTLRARGVDFTRAWPRVISLKTPDGANIEFAEKSTEAP